MDSFVLLVEFQVRPESLDRFMALIDENARASVEREPGCYQFDVMQTLEDPCKVVLYEVYASARAFEEHLAMPHTQGFLAAAKPLVTQQRLVRMTRRVAPPVKQA